VEIDKAESLKKRKREDSDSLPPALVSDEHILPSFVDLIRHMINQDSGSSDITRLMEKLLDSNPDMGMLEALIRPITPLTWAARAGSFRLTKKLLAAKANVNAPLADSEQRTPLMEAAARGDDWLVSLLLEKNAKTTINTLSDETTALCLAVESGQASTVALLVGAKADLNLKDTEGDSPLHTAIINKKSNIVLILCQAKADLNIKNADDVKPLHLAAGQNDINTVQVLMDAKADFLELDHSGMTAAELADNEDCTLMLEQATMEHFLIDSETPDLKIEASSPSSIDLALFTAIERRNLLETKKIIAAKANVNTVKHEHKFDSTPLIRAAQFDNYPLIKLLLDNKADINAASPLSDGTAISNAALRAQADSVVLLANAKADVRVKDVEGNTTLHHAIRFNLVNAVFALCKAKADVFSPNNEGQTPLQRAYAIRSHTASAAYQAFGKGERLAEQNRLINILEERANEQRNQAVLGGFHLRAGRQSFLSTRLARSSIFDPRVMRVPLGLAKSDAPPIEQEDAAAVAPAAAGRRPL